MGTNFYLKKKMTPEEKFEIMINIDNCDYDLAITALQKYKEIHIGKRSFGWKFLWDANNFEYYSPTKESLIDWLKTGGTIFDEYGDEYTFDEFWNNELPEQGIDIEEYYRNPEHQKEYVYHVPKAEIDHFWKKHGISVNKYGEFYLSDLRFTTSTDFS